MIEDAADSSELQGSLGQPLDERNLASAATSEHTKTLTDIHTLVCLNKSNTYAAARMRKDIL